MNDSRTKTIVLYMQSFFHETGRSMESFADDVVRWYAANVRAEHRTVEFHSGGDAYARLRANGQIVNRFLTGTLRLPVDLEEALIFALPADIRRELLRELAQRVGLMAAPLPDASGRHDVEQVGVLVREFGEAVAALGPVLGDGRIGADDAPHLRAAVREVEELIEQATALRARLLSVSEGRGANVTVLPR